ncbi:MAG: DUF1320 domain-containing protein [FCB group bacterium]|nr:DUF1320 domain-containing protein [FCB group bacterium]
MSVYYSTEASVEAKVAALDIQHWLDPDGDGNIDEDALTSALSEAKEEILSYVEKRYGSTIVDAWDSDTRPAWIGQVSDWLTLYHSLPGYSAENPIALRRYDENIVRLQKVARFELMIPGIDFVSGQDNTTSRVQYLECTDADAESGYCDPCAYEYT